MGYTHQWNNKKDIPIEIMQKIVHDFNIIYQAYKNQIKIQYEDDSRADPIICKDLIRFNGVGDEGHETFVFSREAQGEFCKTTRKPYDLYVACLLIIIKHHAKDRIHIGTDGGPYDNEWIVAFNVCRKALNIADVEVCQDWDNEHRYHTCYLKLI